MELFTCKDLSLGYGAKEIISGLNFSVNEGEYFGIVGENGAGKSTLIKTLLSLQKPMGGKIIPGKNFCPGSIGYLPQQTEVQKDFPASVDEIVRTGCQRHGHFFICYSKEQKKTAEKAMQDTGILNLAKRCYRELSGGQMQRVLLARALCAAEHALLLDEPVTGLDPQATENMYNLIYELNTRKKKPMTIIMISHDVQGIKKWAHRILHLGNECYIEKGERQ